MKFNIRTYKTIDIDKVNIFLLLNTLYRKFMKF